MIAPDYAKETYDILTGGLGVVSLVIGLKSLADRTRKRSIVLPVLLVLGGGYLFALQFMQ